MQTLGQDLRFGIRMLLKNPAFTVVALITLALGIGANTAIFSVVNAVLLNPLPYDNPERLVTIWRGNPARGWSQFPVSVPDFLDWKQRNQVFDGLAAFVSGSVNLADQGEPEAVQGTSVSVGLFETLGVKPTLGRGFVPGEDQPGATPVVVLSHGLWQRRFGSDPAIIGKSLRLDAQTLTIVGVMPAGFNYPEESQLWTALTLDPQQSNRGQNFLSVIARLKFDVSLERAQANMESISLQLEKEYPQTDAGYRAELEPLFETMVGNTRKPLLVLFGAIGFVLLIACANVANLLLVRAAGRQKEMAVRAALGAGRWRLVRQLLTESILLATLGGAGGLLLVTWGLDLLVSFSPMKIARLNEVSIDGTVLGFTLGIVLLTGIIFGLMPVFRISDSDLRESLKEGAGRASAGVSRRRLRQSLVIAEMALSLVLLVGAGLLIKSFFALRSVDPGFQPEGVLTMNLVLPTVRYPQPENRAAFIQQVSDQIQAIPGISSAATAAYVPLGGNNTSRRFAIEGRPLPEPGQEPIVNDLPVSPDYFRTLGIPLLQGRGFTPRDDAQAPGVVIVNQSFANRFFPGEDVVGKRIRYYSQRATPPWIEIVGVVGNVRQRWLDTEPEPIIYRPHLQSPWGFLSIVVRTSGGPLTMVGAVKSAIQSVDKDQAVSKITTLDRVLGDSIAQRRALMILLGVFAAIALALATVGIYGVMAYSVVQRTHEIGVRIALGAQSHDVFKLVVGQGMMLALIGIVIGLAAALALTRVLTTLLFEVSPTDPITFTGIAVLLTAVALLASYIPARRATRVDPMVALHYE